MSGQGGPRAYRSPFLSLCLARTHRGLCGRAEDACMLVHSGVLAWLQVDLQVKKAFACPSTFLHGLSRKVGEGMPFILICSFQ